MVTTPIVVAPAIDFADVRAEFDLVDGFPSDALDEARQAADRYADVREDRTDLPLVTIDPPGSMDLDQALHLERTDDGFVLHYAIADVYALVEPGGALDAETHRRGQTFYLPDGSVPLHPREVSEGTASLLPDVVRPAALWRIETDHGGEPVAVSVRRALVRSVARMDYAGVQRDADADRLHPSVEALPDFGRLRSAAALARGAIELRLPTQDVVPHGDGWRLQIEPRTEADEWNSEISLLTGMCAAQMMIDAGVGLLRTLPAADPAAVDGLRRTARSLDVPWPPEMGVGSFLAGLDAHDPRTLVLMSEAPTLLRGASYAAFDGELPETILHGAIGAPYAHVTAPLRRLSDRYATEVCLAVSSGLPVPEAVRAELSAMPKIMSSTDSLAGKVNRACIDLTEAVVLAPRVGETFEATVLKEATDRHDAEVFVASETVIGPCGGAPEEGSTVRVRLTLADPQARKIRFDHDR
ncbi:ribonuclease II [Rhodococcus sp. 852002-51564_SCH6189132-a]|uniref:RNB domain-containing ribonuclease n=1 Tax=Rhodococcus TaxID=1827 RepID=UPI0007EBFFAE|nr:MULTISPECIES: RNB domain-containing ribonuclease [Rhodococcus]OBA33837.1 ribonuclease II [Rhodococcus sp. 852002-51564_SCH6189132-a]UPK64872.1 RNB domain-containing ribonuclease [Rhodococcus pyridinivorans]